MIAADQRVLPDHFLRRYAARSWQLFQRYPVPAYACVVILFIGLRYLFTHLGELFAAWPRAADFTYAAAALTVTLSVASILVIALPFQLLWPAVRRKPKIASAEFWLDVFYWHQGLLLQMLSLGAAVSILNGFVWGWANGPWLPTISTLPFWLQVVFAIWAYDFIVYWRHRSEHTFRPLWSFHAVHHSTTQVDVLTTLRLHPLEIVYGTVTNAAVLYVGVDPKALALAYTLYTYWNYFIHTNVRVRFSGFMQYVLVTPFMHQWHHALDAAAAGKNVGVVFAWNDWLFGTAYHPQHWPTEFGIDVPETERLSARSYLRQLFYPVQYALAQFRRAR